MAAEVWTAAGNQRSNSTALSALVFATQTFPTPAVLKKLA
jgi:hypothetical protein